MVIAGYLFRPLSVLRFENILVYLSSKAKSPLPRVARFTAFLVYQFIFS
jgi:hypothetical protein